MAQLVERWRRPSELDRARDRSELDLAAEARRCGLSVDHVRTLWDRAIANATDAWGRCDEARAQQAFLAAARRAVPDVGRHTRVEAELGGAGELEAARRDVPGRMTRVTADAGRGGFESVRDAATESRDEPTATDVVGAARHGIAERGGPLPHLDVLQRAFGPHDLSSVEAHVGGAAAQASARLDATAYAFGSHVAFARWPGLFLAAHEAAHVVQQRAGIDLPGGVDRGDDAHERHADAVAARVVSGLSVAHLFGGGGGQSHAAVQRQRADAAAAASPTPATADPAPPAPVPAPAAAARHDGSATTPLGEGDEVWDADGHVIVAFAGTAAGVVEAAFYELHRGDPRSLAEIMRDDTRERTTPGARAGQEGMVRGTGTNTDATGSTPIAHRTRVTGTGTRMVRHVTACGPVECYLRSAGARAGTAWCGSFATFVYLRCGIIGNGDTMAWSHNVPNVMARLGSDEASGDYYRFTGRERHHGASRTYDGDFEEGEHSTRRAAYHAASFTSALQFDIRSGDVFWMEHDASSGHVGIIVGVHRTAQEITLVTIEGNANNQVRTRTRMIRVTPAAEGGHGAAAHARVTSDIKGWGRPPALHAGNPTPEGGELPAWMAAAATQPRGAGTDR